MLEFARDANRRKRYVRGEERRAGLASKRRLLACGLRGSRFDWFAENLIARTGTRRVLATRKGEPERERGCQA
jgi:hypothetical protein